MSKRIFSAYNWTPGVVADASPLANDTYMALKGGSASQILDSLDIYISGMAAAAAPMPLCLARTSTNETTPTALANPASDGPAHPSVAPLAAPPVSFTRAAAGPQRSAATSDARLNLGMNAFGGAYRWNAAPTQQWTQVGNGVGGGETLLSNLPFGTVGLINVEWTYEPL